MMKILLDREENIVETGENAGYQHFLLFPIMFSKYLYCRHVKTMACLGKVRPLPDDNILDWSKQK